MHRMFVGGHGHGSTPENGTSFGFLALALGALCASIQSLLVAGGTLFAVIAQVARAQTVHAVQLCHITWVALSTRAPSIALPSWLLMHDDFFRCRGSQVDASCSGLLISL